MMVNKPFWWYFGKFCRLLIILAPSCHLMIFRPASSGETNTEIAHRVLVTFWL